MDMSENIQPVTVKRNLPRDVFLHLLAIVTLYWSAVSFVALCWQYINYFFYDIASGRMNYYGFSGPIRFAVASLVIVFPVFLLVSWFLNKIYSKESVVRESRVRKWLVYLTLFIAALTIIVDLVSVINTFLGGEITVRFILKALSVLVVAIFVFGYYLDDVRKSQPSPLGKYFAMATGAIVLALVVGSFFIIGSPRDARLLGIDQQKISDLEGVQYQIVNYWQKKGQLPATLNDLKDEISGYAAPVDAQTGSPYEYSVTDAKNLSFELCAQFNMASASNQMMPKYATPIGGQGISQNWDHAAGRVCFERQIDRQLYPPFNQNK